LALVKKHSAHILAIGLITIVLWQATIINSPKFLTSFDFEAGELIGWEIRGNNPQATSTLLVDDTGNFALKLNIPDTDQGSWTGIGRQIPVKANQSYRISIDYRLAGNTPNSSTVCIAHIPI